MTGRAAERLREQAGTPSAETSRSVALRPVTTVATLRDLLQDRRGAIIEALPRDIDVSRFMRTVITEAQRTPRLLECTTGSVLGAAMLAAQLGLEPGPLGAVYLIPRANRRAGTVEASFLLGYRGIIQLGLRSNRVRRIGTDVVRERDTFHFERGTSQELRHRYDHTMTDERRGSVVAAWGLVEFTNGGVEFEVLSHDQIEARRKRSAAANDGPWVTDYAAMARKSAVRALAPYLPLSPDLERGLRADGAVTERLEPDLADSLTPAEREELEPLLTEGPEEMTPPLPGPPAPAGTPPPAATGRRSRASARADSPAGPSPAPTVVEGEARAAETQAPPDAASHSPSTPPAAPPENAELPLANAPTTLSPQQQLMVRIETAHSRLNAAHRGSVAGSIYAASGWDSLSNPRSWLEQQQLVTLEAIAQELEGKLA